MGQRSIRPESEGPWPGSCLLPCAAGPLPSPTGRPVVTARYGDSGLALARFGTAVLDELGLDSANVLGASFGGAVAQQMAFSHPGRVRRLVLASTSFGAFALPGNLEALWHFIHPRSYHPERLEQVAGTMFGGRLRTQPQLVRSMHMQRPTDTWAALYRMAPLFGWTSLPWLWAVGHPTLVIAGDDDPVTPLLNHRVMAMLMPRARLHTVRGGGHMVLLDSAQHVGPVIISFLHEDRAASDRELAHPTALAWRGPTAPRSLGLKRRRRTGYWSWSCSLPVAPAMHPRLRSRCAGEADVVSLVHAVEVPRRAVSLLEPVIGARRYAELVGAAHQLSPALAGRTIWNVNSTAAGGGVAEMLQVLVGYVQDLDVRVGWLLISGDAEFFAITKRLHNQIHGSLAADPLGTAEARHYAHMLAANAVELAARVRPGDVVLLHDPQTAGLAKPLAEAGARVVWRCHVGVDWENDVTMAGWDFLRPHLSAAEAYVFSRQQYVPSWIPAERAWVIPPSIDPFSPKNQQLDAGTVQAILARLGVLDGADPAMPAKFVRRDGYVDQVTRPAVVVGEGLPRPDDSVLIQVSRWDRLKDMAGVMRGFADHVVPGADGYLMLVGPSVKDVSDDPEGAAVYGECLLQWHKLNPSARARILLVTLPLDDIDENAAMVNALQRHATVIVQKSLAEGFGLTVAEGMWKERPVIGSAVGGIIDQVIDGTGILFPDPADLAAFGSAARLLLDDQAQATRMGKAAHSHVREQYLADVHLLRYARLLRVLIGGR
jgi:trehalose synthase